MKPGIYTDLSNDDYHKSEGISCTGLKLFDADQSSLEWARNCPVDTEKTAALDFGDAVHAILLEPERLSSDFLAAPRVDLRTNAGKAVMAEFKEANQDKTIITHEERRKLDLIYGSVMAHTGSRKLIEADGIAECSYYWEDKETGVLCKTRPDKNLTGTNILMDVKTTHDLNRFKFSIEDLQYYLQPPFYLDGVNAFGEEKTVFVFLVVQSTIECGRYPVRCVVLPEEVVEYGRSQYKRILYDYMISRDSGKTSWVYQQEIPNRLMSIIEGTY